MKREVGEIISYCPYRLSFGSCSFSLSLFCFSLKSSEENQSPAAERPQQDDAVERPQQDDAVEKSPEERPSPGGSPSGGPESDRSDSSSSDDDTSSSDDEHAGALRRIRSSVAQIRVS